MTDRAALRERVAEAIHDGLGGNGWAYANYGGDELVTEADKLAKAASAAIDLVLEEAARVVRRMPSPSSEWMADELLRALGAPANQVPEDIRALKSGK